MGLESPETQYSILQGLNKHQKLEPMLSEPVKGQAVNCGQAEKRKLTTFRVSRLMST